MRAEFEELLVQQQMNFAKSISEAESRDLELRTDIAKRNNIIGQLHKLVQKKATIDAGTRTARDSAVPNATTAGGSRDAFSAGVETDSGGRVPDCGFHSRSG